jgi:hypothetical protein
MQYPWQQFVPHPEWVSADQGRALSLDAANWIWFPEGNPAIDAPTEKRYFRRTFTLPATKIIEAALKMSADDAFTVYLNGTELGSHANWQTGREFTDIRRFLNPGENVLAAVAANAAAPVAHNPAGLIANLEVAFADSTTLTVVTDASWQSVRSPAAHWTENGFDASGWQSAMLIAPYGQGPWGQAARQEAIAPFCAGEAGGTRVIYLPEARAVTVRGLHGGRAYRANWLDPISGRSYPALMATANADGSWRSPEPPASGRDWLLTLRPVGGARRLAGHDP